MKKCANCKHFANLPFDEEGDCPYSTEVVNRNKEHCKKWQRKETDDSETLTILRATLECYERQYEYSCHLGDARCVKCDYNIRQGTISEHMEALSEAILALEKQIPKRVEKVKRRPTEWGSPYICPICGAEQTKAEFATADGEEPKEMYTWCYGCGHKLDWKGVDK